VQITGIVDANRTIAGVEKYVQKMDAAIAREVKVAGLAVEKKAKLKLTESGRHKKGTKTPSIPPAPPAIITGTLRRSITTSSPKRVGFGTYKVEIGPTAVYGRVQELGGGPRNLPARPYMAPALREAFPEIEAAIRRAGMTRG